jgi:hypothetical protein
MNGTSGMITTTAHVDAALFGFLCESQRKPTRVRAPYVHYGQAFSRRWTTSPDARAPVRDGHARRPTLGDATPL